MDFTGLGLAGLGFWVAVAAIGLGFIWSSVKKQQMKHEMTLKLLEKGQSVDQELLAKLLAADKPGAAMEPKSVIEQQRDAGGVIGFLFLVAGLIFAFVGILGTGSELVAGPPGPTGVPLMVFEDKGPSWLLIGLGAFTFLFGWLCWVGGMKEYHRAKAEEKQAEEKQAAEKLSRD